MLASFHIYSSFFFFSSRRRHTRFKCDWSSDVCSSDLADDLAAGGSAHDGIVDEHHALAFNQATDGIELELHTEIADSLRRLDKGAADVMIANQAHAEGNLGFEGVADGGRHAGIGHGNDDIGVDGMLLREGASEHLAAFVHGAAETNTLQPAEITLPQHPPVPSSLLH